MFRFNRIMKLQPDFTLGTGVGMLITIFLVAGAWIGLDVAEPISPDFTPEITWVGGLGALVGATLFGTVGYFASMWIAATSYNGMERNPHKTMKKYPGFRPAAHPDGRWDGFHYRYGCLDEELDGGTIACLALSGQEYLVPEEDGERCVVCAAIAKGFDLPEVQEIWNE